MVEIQVGKYSFLWSPRNAAEYEEKIRSNMPFVYNKV